jgi:hypothetical protein
VSVLVQALLSEQAVPSGLAGLEHSPVAGSQVPASWHWSEAVQVTGSSPTQVPSWQVSVLVQALPSLQAVPFGLGCFSHSPVVGLQTPTVHWSLNAGSVEQSFGGPAVQTPAWQVSVVQALLSATQVVPSALGGLEHRPVVGSQTPASWHWSEAVQVLGSPPVQTPSWQVSVCVQRSPSLQAVPLAFLGLEHCPVCGSQVPAVWH